MKNIYFFSVLLFVAGCSVGKKAHEGYVCRTTNHIVDAEDASESRLICSENNGLKTFHATCDFTVDSSKYGREYLLPTTMVWVYNKDKDKEGINYTHEKRSGFMACSKNK